jgi:hypothetical protein
MILPLYTNLVKMDLRLLEAAADLGASPWKAFWKITVPLSKAGIIAGSMLVFIPAVGEFVIPNCWAARDTLMIGRVLWDEFFNNRDWPMASAVAIVMLMLLIVPILIFNRVQQREAGREADMSSRQARRHAGSVLGCWASRSCTCRSHPDHLLVQRVAAGHGVVGLLAEVVRRAAATSRCSARRGSASRSRSGPRPPRWCWARWRRW